MLVPAALLQAVRAAGFELVANETRLEAYGDGPFPAHLAEPLIRQKKAVLAMLPFRCSLHGQDYRAWCGACGPAFPDDLPLDAVDHRTGRLWNR